MKLLYDFKTINEAEDLDQSLHSLHLISININVLMEDFYCTSSRPLLFDCGAFTRHITRLPRLEVEHDDSWDEFGRAYYDSRDFQFTEFHVTLCSVDELRQQIEAKMREFEQNNIISVACVVKEERHSSLLDRYFVENDWNEDLLAWIEDFQARNLFAENIWVVRTDYSCHPYHDKSLYLHQLAKLSLSGTHPQARMAARPCCRSFLMASCRQSSGDDLLGH
ncbi:MAG: hypothetical protein K6G25_07040 [Bacteroidales bacterium]|nr:hypothetical protein [Bacteroidales bacterium]